VGYDLIVLWKTLPETSKLYTVFFLVSGGYAGYSLARVFIGFGNSKEKDALTRVEHRIRNVRQLILLLLLLFGMTVGNEAFIWSRSIRLSQSQWCDCIDASGLWAVFDGVLLAGLAFLHLLQWIASTLLQRRASDLGG
jgi:hypothetical protein